MSKQKVSMVAFQWLLLLITVVARQSVVSASTTPPIALAGCQDHCGKISIPYPFGIGSNCFHNSWFEIVCNETYVPPKAYLVSARWILLTTVFDNGPFSVLGIDIGASPNKRPTATGTLSIRAEIGASPNKRPTATGTLSIRAETMGVVSSILQPQPVGYPALDLRGSPYVVSGMRNSLLVVGCGGSVGVANINNQTVAGCSTLCSSLSSTMKSNNYSCFGTGCCQSSIPTSLDYFKLEFQATTINGSISESGSVDAVVVDNSFFANNSINGTFFRDFEGDFPTLLLWTVPGLPISSAKYSNSLCDWDADLKGYSCRCRYEYHAGNPFDVK